MKRILSLLLAALLLAAVSPAFADAYFSMLLIGEGGTLETVQPDVLAYGSADALVIVSVNLKNGAIRMLSIERLMKADVPGMGEVPINLANAQGGPEMQLRTVNDLFSFHISTYMMVDRSIMGELVTIIGDVPFDVTADDLLITLPDGNAAFEKTGLQTINGAQAVALMAAKGTDETGGDARRNQRQRDVLIAIVKESMFNPDFDMVLKLVTRIVPLVDTNITMADIVSAAIPVILNGYLEPGQMRTPEDGTPATVNGFSVIVSADMDAQRARTAAFLYGDR